MKKMFLLGWVGLGLMMGSVQAEDLKREQDLSELEGKEPPALKADGWLNTEDGKALKLADLKGKVVLIDFWGVW